MLIYLSRSRCYLAALSIFYLNIALALWLVNWPLYLRIIIFIILFADYLRLQKKPPVKLLFKDCDKWQYELASDKRYKASLIKKKSYYSKYVLVLYFKYLTGSRYIIVPYDAVTAQDFRTLSASY